uniref:NADH-ubiquinone oxidoreductase chain 5 n=1 Tax=Perionyx excavatus TaxID=168854 RepID=A6YFD6_9ANNE|nr:NADH dehydrogenase subunit 5 [Perionyx excavatus]ABQ01587.1 NADH dehydrogenase subunit 5 [Perionyx excavatus]
MLRQFKIHKQASALMWVMLAMMVPLTIYLTMLNKTILIEWTLFTISSTPMTFTLIADPTGTLFSATALLISANVLQFSTIYMKDDKFIDRFSSLSATICIINKSINFLPHLMMLLLGWDGLGLVSFILVIYYQNPKSLAAGMITALTNRIGDVMLLLSIAWTLNQGHWSITHMWHTDLYNWQVAAITLAAMTKSAQMPFSSWLPAAMAAPTPVSALVHSSTLVTAGVFLLIRFYPFLTTTTWFNKTLLLIAVLTTTMAGLSAMTECDMKKIIALSTLSQLGMMMTAMGLGMVNLAYFHMVTHALFKALLFICAGTLINSHYHSQDLRWMGNITAQMPTTTSCFILANMALCGAPFMSGFYSKDMIIESSVFYHNNYIMLLIIMFTVSLTSFYTTRFSLATIWSPSSSAPFSHLEENNSLTTPMLVLALMSVTSGAAMLWTMPTNQEPMTITLDYKTYATINNHSSHFNSMSFTTFYIKNTPLMMNNPLTHYASCLMWFLVPLSSQFTMKTPMNISHNYLKSLDQSWLETFGGQGTAKMTYTASNSVMNLSNIGPVNYLMMSATLAVIMSAIM